MLAPASFRVSFRGMMIKMQNYCTKTQSNRRSREVDSNVGCVTSQRLRVTEYGIRDT